MNSVMPLIRSVFSKLTSGNLVAAQPMTTGPKSLVWYMDYRYNTTSGRFERTPLAPVAMYFKFQCNSKLNPSGPDHPIAFQMNSTPRWITPAGKVLIHRGVKIVP